MVEKIEGVNPTRMELLKVRKQAQLAQKGHKLLKEKRDALVMQFFKIVERAKESRDSVNSELSRAFRDLILAEALAGTGSVEGASLASKKAGEVGIEKENIMGVEVPKVEHKEFRRKVVERGYGFLDTHPKVDEAAAAFEDALTKILGLAEVEGSVKRLGGEIQKTKRRVNALEYIRIPLLTNTQKYVQMRLDEMERENFFRLKIIKRRLTR